MSALAEALVAAQRRALSALAKSYVATGDDKEAVKRVLDRIGLRDKIEQDEWLAALDVIREAGAQLPTEATPTNGGEPKPPEPASDAQLALIADLVKRKNVPAPDLPLTKVDASAIISALQAGTYDPSKWSVPF